MILLLQLLFIFAEEDIDPRYVLLILLASGFIFYTIIYLKYRNTDKRHYHEKETKVKVENMKQQDKYKHSERDLRSKYITGANFDTVKGVSSNAKESLKIFGKEF